MKIPDYVKPGALVTTRRGVQGRIYNTDGSLGTTVHGAILDEITGWQSIVWCAGDLRAQSPHDARCDIMGPWVEVGVDVPDPTGFWEKQSAWMNWAAQDQDGRWFVYAYKPDLGYGCWVLPNAELGQSKGIYHTVPPEYTPTFTGNWENSLIQRPTP